MLNYATVGSNDLDKAKAFYDALLAPIGMGKLFDHRSGGRIYGQFGKSAFAVLGPIDGGEASVGNGSLVGFELDSPEALAAFHAHAMELGGTDEGAPGMPQDCISPTSVTWTATSCAATTSKKRKNSEDDIQHC